MMWNRIARIEDAPVGHSIKDKLLANLSEYIWLVTRDDSTPVCLGGLYRPIAIGGDNIVWFAPYPALRPSDWRGLKKLVDILKGGGIPLTALIERDNAAAVRVVEHLDFTLITDAPERVYKWPN